MPENPRLQAPTKSVKSLVAIASSARRRHNTLWKAVQLRRLHFYNDDAVNPGEDSLGLGTMPAAVSHIHFQTDIIRQKWEQLKARLTENHWVADVSPVKEAPEQNKAAEQFGELLNALGQIIEERLGYTLQGAMADGQIIDCYSVLHVRRLDQQFPRVPEYEYLDELPDDEDERKRFKDEPEEEGEKAGKFRETAESLEKRTKHLRARAGSPYMIEVGVADDWAFVDDEMGAEAIAVHTQTRGVLDYGDELNKTDKLVLSAGDTEGGSALRVYLEGAAPKTWEEARSDWDEDRMITVMTVWTRDAWYELASHDALMETEDATMTSGEWEIVKSGRHAFGRVPAVRIPAVMYNGSRDPRWRWLPAAEGLFRRKPFFDRDMALTKGIAEWGLPRLLMVNTKGAPRLDENGNQVAALAEDTAAADVLPEGYDIRTVVAEVTQSQILMLQQEQQALDDAAPDTGIVELDSGEKPWTARSRIQQANVTPKSLLDAQQRGLVAVLRMIAKDISTPVDDGGLGGSVWAYKRGEDGKEDQGTIIGVEPGDIQSLMVGVSINAISNAEKITLVEHGVGLWQAGVLTLRQLLEEYFVVPDPMDREADIVAERVFKTQLEPGRIAFWVAKEFGSKYAVGIDGQIVGLGGKSVNPEATAMARGMKPVNPMGMNAGGMGTTLPDLQDSAGPSNVMRQPTVAG